MTLDLDLRSIGEVPIVGSIAAGAVDILMFGGDTIAALGTILIETLDLWVPLLSYLSRLSDSLGWIPSVGIERALLVGMGLLVLVYAVRIVRKATETLRN